MSQCALLFSLPYDAFPTKVPDPSWCLLHAFGSIQRYHEYCIEAQEGREEVHRAMEQVERETEGAEKGRIKEVYTD